MTRLIDADALKEDLTKWFPQFTLEGIEPRTLFAQIMRDIDNAPTVDLSAKWAEAHSMGYDVGYTKGLEDARPKGEWIPVSERLPDDMQKVLIWFEYYRYGDFNCMYQTYGFGYVCDGKWSPFINGETGWQDYNIIAWQPLPEPYKAGGKEE